MKKPPPMPDVDENAPGVERELDHAEGVDPEQYKEYWAERQGFPQQDDADLEVELDQVSEATETDQVLETDEVPEGDTLPETGEGPEGNEKLETVDVPPALKDGDSHYWRSTSRAENV